MARILIVDGNPDTQRTLSGLIKYRTRHTFAVVDSCQAAIRQAVSRAPDIILINALLFMHSNYAFPRVMQRFEQTARIAFLVHAMSSLGEVSRRQIEASGVAGVFELPISADELNGEIQAALKRRRPKKTRDVQPVQWQRVAVETPGEPKERQRFKGKPVKAVQWPVVSAENSAASKKKSGPKSESGVRKRSAQRALPDGETPKKKAFRTAAFPSIEPSEQNRVKGQAPEAFEEKIWEAVDPKAVKGRGRKR